MVYDPYIPGSYLRSTSSPIYQKNNNKGALFPPISSGPSNRGPWPPTRFLCSWLLLADEKPVGRSFQLISISSYRSHPDFFKPSKSSQVISQFRERAEGQCHDKYVEIELQMKCFERFHAAWAALDRQQRDTSSAVAGGKSLHTSALLYWPSFQLDGHLEWDRCYPSKNRPEVPDNR